MFAKLQELRDEREAGFTLIELLVVILIIGILAAIAIPAFLNQRKSAVDSSVQSDVSNAAKQVETLLIKAGSSVAGSISIGTVTNGEQTITLHSGATSATSAVATIKAQVSDGTTLAVGTAAGDATVADGYVIKGTNPGGDVAATTAGFSYNSATGGMQ